MRRALASLMMLWFAVTTVEPEALHQCEMHGGSHAAPAAAMTGDAAADEHAGHDMGADAPVSADAPPDETHHCSCIDQCCSAVVTDVPDQAIAAFAPESVRREATAAVIESVIATTPGVRLPFATAPPALPGTALS